MTLPCLHENMELVGEVVPEGQALWNGSFKEFSLGSVLQVLGRIQATGTLHVYPLGVKIHFKSGFIQAVEDMIPLGDLLLAQGSLTESQLELALRSNVRPLGQALLSMGLEKKTLQGGLEIQARLSLALLLNQLESQEFSFFPRQPLPLPDAGLEVSPLLLEWIALTPPLPLGTPLELAPTANPVHLDPDEWRLLRLINGRRTLASILRFSGLDPRVAWQKAEGLVKRGLFRPSALWGLRFIVPQRAPKRTTYHPPSSLMANLFLKWVDGKRTAASIAQILEITPQEGALYLVDLSREGLVEIKQGQAEMAKLLEEF